MYMSICFAEIKCACQCTTRSRLKKAVQRVSVAQSICWSIDFENNVHHFTSLPLPLHQFGGANTKSWWHKHQNIYLLGHFINQISGKSHKPPLKDCKMPWDCQCTRYHVVAVQSLARSKGLEVSRKNLQPSLKRTYGSREIKEIYCRCRLP